MLHVDTFPLNQSRSGAGLAVAMPAPTATPRERIDRLKIELAAALADEFWPDAIVTLTDNAQLPAHVREGSIGCIMATVRG